MTSTPSASADPAAAPKLRTRFQPARLIHCLTAVAVATGLLAGCSSYALQQDPNTALRLAQLQPVDAILLGEQHDAPDHQRVHRDVVVALAKSGQLAALTLEMADQGRSTQGLDMAASEDTVKVALAWSNTAWPWEAYSPAVMAAVRAGVPVLGANLPLAQMSARMSASFH
jgi:hypothetical protein